jgi:hypothetical protein
MGESDSGSGLNFVLALRGRGRHFSFQFQVSGWHKNRMLPVWSHHGALHTALCCLLRFYPSLFFVSWQNPVDWLRPAGAKPREEAGYSEKPKPQDRYFQLFLL